MKHRSDIDRVMQVWMADGPTAIPDRVVEVVAARIGVQRQRRAWPFQGRTVMTPLKVAAGLAAAVVVAVVAWQVLPGSGGIGGKPTPAPTPTVMPSATASAAPTSACNDELTCAGPLAAGAHASEFFAPSLTFTAPAAWINPVDVSNLYELDKAGREDYLLVWSDVGISQHTARCDPLAEPGVGNGVSDWISYVSSHPGLTATTPVDADLGDAHGQFLDLRIKSGWTKTCDGFPGLAVQFIMQTADAHVGTYGAASWNSLRLYVLDVGGKTSLITQYGLISEFDDLIGSMRFIAP